MKTSLLEVLPEILEVILFGLGSLILSIAGAYIEQFALLTVTSGQPMHGAWVAFMGLMAFFFAYLLVTDKFWPKLTEVRQRLRTS